MINVMNQRTRHIQCLSLLALLTLFVGANASSDKAVVTDCRTVYGAFSHANHPTFGTNFVYLLSSIVDSVKAISKEKGLFAFSKGNNYLNESEDDDGAPPQISQTGRAIGENAPNQADYSLEMTYDDMYRVTNKSQHLIQSGVQFNGTLSSGYDLTFIYDQDTGKRFHMSTVNDVNYRTDSVYSSADDMVETQHFEYDKNGNIIHALTAETRAEGTTVNLTREEKFRWDEENRLLAISQNGYVSQYWYDADGERVVKEHGANQAVFVNSEEDGTVTQTDRYSVYPNGYYSYGDDGRYTKHIYIGAERIASQVGGKPYPSPNTESVSVAGRSSGIDIRVDYSGKLDQHLAQIDSVYDAFDLPYNGTNHDSYYNNYFFDRPGYWDNTEGMTLNGGEPETPRGIQDRDLLYYYHRDHLGSSTAVSNDDGRLAQQIEYLPYGEVFLEKQMASSDYHSPHKFNGKELDKETGLYYYGARYMNPRLSIWYATDPMQEKFPNVSSYAYCMGNPVLFLDPNGQILYISGDCADNAYSQLVEKYKDSNLSLNKDDNGLISYTISDNKKLKGDAKRIAEIIDNEQITVRVDAVKEDTYSGASFFGGAFMGAFYNKEKGTVQTKQVVNPEILGRIDDFYETPGKMMMHEITESYEAGKISLDKELMIGFASESRNKDQMKYYYKAHNKATPQNPISVTYYDKDGIKHKTDNIKTIKKIEYNVTSKDKNQVIHTVIRK